MIWQIEIITQHQLVDSNRVAQVVSAEEGMSLTTFLSLTTLAE